MYKCETIISFNIDKISLNKDPSGKWISSKGNVCKMMVEKLDRMHLT